MQDLHRHRVEERLGALGLLVVDEEADVAELHLFPQRVGRTLEAEPHELALDAFRGFFDAPIVEVDAIASDVRDGEPVSGLVVALRGARALPEQRVMAIEALEHHTRERERGRRRRALGAGSSEKGRR